MTTHDPRGAENDVPDEEQSARSAEVDIVRQALRPHSPRSELARQAWHPEDSQVELNEHVQADRGEHEASEMLRLLLERLERSVNQTQRSSSSHVARGKLHDLHPDHRQRLTRGSGSGSRQS